MALERTSENTQYFTSGSWVPDTETHFHPGDPDVVDRNGKQVPGPVSHITWTAPNGVQMLTLATDTLGPDDDWGSPDGFMVIRQTEDGRTCTRIAGRVRAEQDYSPVEVWTICSKVEAWREVR